MNAMTRAEAEAKLAKLRELHKKVEAEMEALARTIAASDRPKTTRRSRYVEPECGTESGYQRHRYKGEEKCDACKQGHREHQREASAARRSLLEHIIERSQGSAA